MEKKNKCVVGKIVYKWAISNQYQTVDFFYSEAVEWLYPAKMDGYWTTSNNISRMSWSLGWFQHHLQLSNPLSTSQVIAGHGPYRPHSKVKQLPPATLSAVATVGDGWLCWPEKNLQWKFGRFCSQQFPWVISEYDCIINIHWHITYTHTYIHTDISWYI